MPAKPQDKSSARRWLKRLLLFAACAALLLVVGLAILIVPEQLRDVSDFSISFQLPEKEEADSPRNEEADTALIPPSEAAAENRSTSETWETGSFTLSLSSETTSPPLVVKILPKDYRLIPDFSIIAEEHLDSARELNLAADAYTSTLLSLFQDLDDLTFGETWNKLGDARETFDDVWDKCRDERKFPFSQYKVERQELHRLYDALQLKLAIDFEDWESAGVTCWRLGMRDDKWDAFTSLEYRKSPWWAAEIYFYRKCGLKGNALIAVRSVSPVLFMLGKSFDKAASSIAVSTGMAP